MTTKNRRRYDMANRERQAADTRQRIVDAALALFLRDGYAATTINAIASQAGVAVQTIYTNATSKREILKSAIDIAVRGDAEDRDVSVRASQRWKEITLEPDAPAALRMFARLHREICEREVDVFTIMTEAAATDPDIKTLMVETGEKRYQDQSDLARSIQRHAGLHKGITARRAADVIWTLANETTYFDLVRLRGWEPQAYERWLGEQLIAALLP